MHGTSEVDMASTPSHVFVEHYPDLTYRQFDGDRLFPGGRALRFDLLKPVTDAPTPLVVFIKGGGFRNVHRARYLPALTALAQTGVAVASVEYRTSNEARFPAQVEDVRHAIRHLRAHADELDVQPDAVAVWGNSAGATIATIVAAAPPDSEDGVRAGVSWYGVHDPALTPAYEHPDSPIRAVLGPGPSEGGRWFQPSDHIRADSAPTLLVHGTADQVVEVRQSLALAAELERQGVPHELLLVRGAGHSFADMCTRTNALARTTSFLRTHLVDEPE